MYFAVIREQGPKWDASLAMREQGKWPEHVEFINRAADEGFLLLAGPHGDGRPYRALLIVTAASEGEVSAHLDDDPWTTAGVLETRSIDRWDVLVGEFAAPG
jgi:uncharacterized protein YciI